MNKIFMALSISLFLMNCTAYNGHFYVHSGPMNEPIESEHIHYQDGALIIDKENIELPRGEKLKIKYQTVNGVTSYVVKVDGKIVKSVQATEKEQAGN